MISGVAQVMAMKPIFRSFFSSGPGVAAIASSAPIGSSEAIAARAVFAPTAFRKRRRSVSFGNSALTSVLSTRPCNVAGALSAWPPSASWKRPQPQRRASGRSAS